MSASQRGVELVGNYVTYCSVCRPELRGLCFSRTLAVHTPAKGNKSCAVEAQYTTCSFKFQAVEQSEKENGERSWSNPSRDPAGLLKLKVIALKFKRSHQSN